MPDEPPGGLNAPRSKRGGNAFAEPDQTAHLYQAILLKDGAFEPTDHSLMASESNPKHQIIGCWCA
jgi:hypothetical protein